MKVDDIALHQYWSHLKDQTRQLSGAKAVSFLVSLCSTPADLYERDWNMLFCFLENLYRSKQQPFFSLIYSIYRCVHLIP